jgi:hypothetical protein
MVDRLIIEPMTSDFVVWRCPHTGALNKTNIDHPMPNPQVNWPRVRARNLPLLNKLLATYGTCALLARDDDAIVATLRFYPKALCTFTDSGLGFCLQQEFPAGPPDQLALRELSPLDMLDDKTLFVHCLMVAAPEDEPDRYRRKGLATRMVRELISWSRRGNWSAIEASAYEEIPYLYAISGVAGKRSWEKLGFRVIQQDWRYPRSSSKRRDRRRYPGPEGHNTIQDAAGSSRTEITDGLYCNLDI